MRKKKSWEYKKRIETEMVCNWKPHIREQTSIDSADLGELDKGDIIIIMGRVLESHTLFKKPCRNKQSRIIYEVLQTRKLIR
ncbi:MAG: hypothetical protein AMJ73_10100 [candidate division Zixibacteria bacterium SM1_73]|nr:MAG: hypothetical protein AMJ73_10100 [candidate division Zixibacteria bacterium SM1_73]